MKTSALLTVFALLTWTPEVTLVEASTLISAETAAFGQDEAAAKVATEIDWFDGSFKDLMAKAKEDKRQVYLHFWASWNRPSIMLRSKIQSDPETVKMLEPYLCFSVDVLSDKGKPLAKRFNTQRPPRMLVLSPNQKVIDFIEVGFTDIMEVESFQTQLKRIESGEGTIPSMAKLVEESPDDLELRFEYALKLRTVGDQAGFQGEVHNIRRIDPEEKSRPMRVLKLEQLSSGISDFRRQAKHKAPLVEQLETFIKNEEEGPKDRQLLFDSWKLSSTFYQQSAIAAKRRYAHDEARKFAPQAVTSWRKAMGHSLEKDKLELGPYIPMMFWEMRDYISVEDKAWGLELAEECSKLLPDSVDMMDGKACALYMAGKKDEARALIKRAQGIDPSNWILQERIKSFE